ncbi:circadian clock-controlled protein [Clostridium botulinum]|uniref:circadian clock-controlled protein n=1 Tax=Clostridium botulinum TaxID=1491 RepID=UPI000AAB6C37|nr:circadian clock-controlled protein [Clostridium botulinum]MBY6950368.1 circadian clock-controlled protein [Clostridium botulinum]MCR1138618.1 circadian clock-controlled protein [Clostridium botulinum]NEZ80838.1 circadian clock-controlled protein [Clostridium botulinum]NFA16650.1 circadian clock-controlled protein [Clostridium botulinum]NFA54779.1 circadian clock-controlled protein [Clostridium botulinum]
MAKKIQVSFKENERDLRLYDYIMTENDRSCFIKNAIECFLECKSLGNEFRYNCKD